MRGAAAIAFALPLLALLLCIPSTSRGAATQDQYVFGTAHLGMGVNPPPQFGAQTAVAGLTGTLEFVHIFMHGNGTSRFLLTVRSVDANGFPTANILGSATAGAPTSLDNSSLAVFQLSPPIFMTAGTPYALALQGTAPSNGGVWEGSGDNIYPGGSVFTTFDGGASFTQFEPDKSEDQFFRTYVNLLPEPGGGACLLVVGGASALVRRKNHSTE